MVGTQALPTSHWPSQGKLAMHSPWKHDWPGGHSPSGPHTWNRQRFEVPWLSVHSSQNRSPLLPHSESAVHSNILSVQTERPLGQVWPGQQSASVVHERSLKTQHWKVVSRIG